MIPWLAERARSTPQAPALESARERLDYGALAERAAAIADRLAALGIGPGARIAFDCGDDALADALLLHGLWWLGATAVPLPGRQPNTGLAPLLAALEIRHLTPAEHSALQELERPTPVTAAVASTHPDKPMVILFSSGSERGPKPIALSARQLAAGVDAAAERLALSAEDRWLCCLPLAHIGGLAILLRAVRTGAGVLLHNRFDAASTAAVIEHASAKWPITRLSLVPTMLHDLLDHHPARFDGRLKSVLIGGAPAAPELLARARAAGLPVLPTWGMTEAGSQLATPSLERAAAIDFLAHPHWVGAPLPGVEVRARADGRLQVRGPMLFSALPGQADGPDAQGWYTTGDCGVIDDQGELTITGRAARVLISGGVNVHLDAVEQRIRAAGLVADIALLAVDDPRWGERAVAAYRPHANDDIADLEAALDRWARSELRPAERPLRWHRIESLPRSATGKVLYAELAISLGLCPPD